MRPPGEFYEFTQGLILRLASNAVAVAQIQALKVALASYRRNALRLYQNSQEAKE